MKILKALRGPVTLGVILGLIIVIGGFVVKKKKPTHDGQTCVAWNDVTNSCDEWADDADDDGDND